MNIDLIKAKVLDLAIKGQLVKQRDDEKLSDEILALPNIEGPFEIPKNWKWIKAEYLIDVISGTSYKKEDITNKTEATSIRIIRGGNIQNGKIYFLDDDIFVKNYLKSHESTIQSKDIVIVASTGSKTVIGKAGLIIDNLIGEHSVQIGAFLRIIRPKHNSTSRYLKLFYLTDYYRNIISHSVSGTNINNIKKSHIVDMLIPYPPLQEQIRIVEKVEEIFSILDALKDHQTSLLSKLDLIRKVAIDKAIKGQLVEQRDDETLSDEILNLPKIDGPFTIPNKWKWVTFNDIAILNPRNKIDDTLEVSFITMSDINAGYSNKFNQNISRWGNVKKGFTHFSEGDVLIAKITPCFQNRKSFVAKSLHNGFGAGTTELHVIRPNISLTNNLYLLWLCKSEYFIKLGTSLLSGSVGQQRISKNELSQIKVPLPPIQEQTRIVQKLEEILSTVSTIENLLKSDKT